MLGQLSFIFSHCFLLIFHSINNVCFLLCMIVFSPDYLECLYIFFLVFFIAIIPSSVLSYPNHWTGSIDFLFYLCPNHCLFCVNQNRLGYTVVKKNNISVTCHNKAYFSLRVLCSLSFSPQQLFLWQLKSQAAGTLWHLPHHTMVQGHSAGTGARFLLQELSASVISVDIPFGIN